jgi:ATP-dependent Clp protease ATP-binding subunit ClpC
MESRVMEEVKKVFNPEFINRIDETIVFHRLGHAELCRIVDIEVAEVIERLQEKALGLELTDDAREYIVRVGTDEQYGARPLRRAVQHYIEDPLSELLLKGEFGAGTRIVVRPSESGDRLVFEPAAAVAEGVTT